MTAVATDPPAEQRSTIDGGPAARVPAATTTRFLLLVLAVLTTSLMAFITVYLSIPAKSEYQANTHQECIRQLAEDPDRPPDDFVFTDIEQLRRAQAAMRRQALCVLPANLDAAAWAGLGVAGLFGLAGVVYWLHPWWIIRRRRLVPLPTEDCPELADYLDQLCRTMRVPRPEWLLAPAAGTVSGQALGRPRRRYVQLDAGLVTRYVTNRTEFRAVALHELAHLRNRDVDKTYLTIGIWWAFVATAFLPMVVLLIQPRIFYDPEHWQWFDLGNGVWGTVHVAFSLLVLTGLMYLTRNAVLRVREIHADAVAAEHDKPERALLEVVSRLPSDAGRRWRAWLRTHPDPQRRLAAIDDPTELLQRGGAWELAGVGLAAGMAGANLMFVVDLLATMNPMLGRALLGLLVSVPMTGMLAVVLWRASLAHTHRRPAPRVWLSAVVMLVVGYLIGSGLSLVGTLAGWTDVPIAIYGTGAVILAAGVTLVAGWILSATQGVLGVPATSQRRWAMPAVVATAVVAVAPWFAVWFMNREIDTGWNIALGNLPDPDGPSWYRHIAQWTGLKSMPVTWLTDGNPLTLPGLVLLWLVPILACWRRSPTDTAHSQMRLGLAIVVGLVGGIGATIGGAALHIAARFALPEETRRFVDEIDLHSVSFAVIQVNAHIALAILAQAVVAGYVAACVQRYRPVLVLLAMAVCATVATIGLVGVVQPADLCLDLHVGAEIPCYQYYKQTSLWDLATTVNFIPEAGNFANFMHHAVVKGVILSVLFAAIGIAASAGWRRRRSDPETSTAEPGEPHSMRLTVTITVILALVAGVSITASLFELPDAYNVWMSGWTRRFSVS